MALFYNNRKSAKKVIQFPDFTWMRQNYVNNHPIAG